tara:strand:+ start:147 stop:425 length:279 start_codon:yes stop_codon:yes gene_type:complete
MKYLKEFKELFEGGDPEKKYDMRVKIKSLDKKEHELMVKKAEAAKKALKEEDPIKQELAVLAIQKITLQKAMNKIDQKVADIKLKVEHSKKA